MCILYLRKKADWFLEEKKNAIGPPGAEEIGTAHAKQMKYETMNRPLQKDRNGGGRCPSGGGERARARAGAARQLAQPVVDIIF